MLDAMSEHDALGTDGFLAKYGFGHAKSYFVSHNGKFYDSKAIAGVAFGKQFPERGVLKNNDFSGGANIKNKLESLDFDFGDDVKITNEDIALIRGSREKSYYYDLSSSERDAYFRVTKALTAYGNAVVSHLGSDDYKVVITSGFSLQSGVRGSVPKDLWFGVHAKENSTEWGGCPQIFMIVSERGIEFGFASATHPSGFSNAGFKTKIRDVAPKIFSLLPEPHDELAKSISQKLSVSGDWYFRDRTRLTPQQNDHPDFSRWLGYLKSFEGIKNSGGSVSKYLSENEISDHDLLASSIGMAEIFGPMMKRVRISNFAGSEDGSPNATSRNFADSLTSALSEFKRVREGPYRKEETLWSIMEDVKASVISLPSVADRPFLNVGWSLGAGNWAGCSVDLDP